ncbi:MAG: NAD(P)/FAD-dependent oxidoreductase [Ignavibacteria bacterium]|jgi:digeranylgeranylglycerophospholipid reductase
MKKEYDIIVIGAGPSGSMAARYASEQGVSVLMLEKDRDVGYPVRCGEAITKRNLVQFIAPDHKWIAAEISKFVVYAPDGTEIVFDFGEVKGYMLERRIFDYELAKTASDAGTEILTRAYVYDLIIREGKVCGVRVEYRGEKIEIRSKIVIGADGVESRVGRWAGLKTHIDFRDMESCFQVTASNVSAAQDSLCFYLGGNYAPGGYFWVFPKGRNISNVGLGLSGGYSKKRSPISYLSEHLNNFYPDASILTQVAGGVPCSVTLEEITGNGIMLAGDAARQVNPLTGGGIGSGMIGGSIAGRIAGEAIKRNDLSHIHSYKKEWHKRRGKLHLILDKIKEEFFEISDEEFNIIFHKMTKLPPEKRTLNKLFMTALAKKPSLLLDVAKVILI